MIAPLPTIMELSAGHREIRLKGTRQITVAMAFGWEAPTNLD
jgi:hypothetical protein